MRSFKNDTCAISKRMFKIDVRVCVCLSYSPTWGNEVTLTCLYTPHTCVKEERHRGSEKIGQYALQGVKSRTGLHLNTQLWTEKHSRLPGRPAPSLSPSSREEAFSEKLK